MLIDEQIEAWKYGPVVPSLFHDLKKYGNQPVDGLIDDLSVDNESGDFTDWSFEVITPTLDQYTVSVGESLQFSFIKPCPLQR